LIAVTYRQLVVVVVVIVVVGDVVVAVVLLSPKESFSKFAAIFLSFWLSADSNPMLVLQSIHSPSSEYDGSIAIF
jgi:hypothetical protein